MERIVSLLLVDGTEYKCEGNGPPLQDLVELYKSNEVLFFIKDGKRKHIIPKNSIVCAVAEESLASNWRSKAAAIRISNAIGRSI